MEVVNLTAPYTADPRQASTLQIDRLELDWRHRTIRILLGDGNLQQEVIYMDLPGNPKATNLMKALNTANLTTNSLHKRVINQLMTDGLVSGTVAGTPD